MTDITNTDTASAPEEVDLDTFSADFFSADNAKDESKTEESESGKDPNTSHGDDETDNPEGELAESSEDEDADNGEESDEGEEKPPVGKKKSRFQERIDDLTAKLREQERLAKAADERLERALAKLEGPAQAEPEDKTQNTPTKTDRGLVEPTADDTLEDGSPKYPLGEFDPKLLRDLTRYDRAVERAHEEEVTAKAKVEQARNTELENLQTEWNGKVETAKEVYPDYVEKGQELLNSLQDVPQDYAVYLTTSIMSMDYGPDVFYYLAEHPEEARAIVASSPEKALTRLGRIEARFEIAANERSGKETKLRTTNAPEPAPRNKGTNAPAPKVDLANADLDDFSREFFRRSKS